MLQVEELRVELESRETSINELTELLSSNEAAITKLRIESQSSSTKLALAEVLPRIAKPHLTRTMKSLFEGELKH